MSENVESSKEHRMPRTARSSQGTLKTQRLPRKGSADAKQKSADRGPAIQTESVTMEEIFNEFSMLMTKLLDSHLVLADKKEQRERARDSMADKRDERNRIRAQQREEEDDKMNQPLRQGDSRIAAREFRNEPEL